MRHIGAVRQRGFTLVVGLILLVLFTLIAVASLNLSRGSLQVLDGMQQRTQSQTAAQLALDQVISGTLFASSPGAVFSSNNCASGTTVANGICVDVNGDGKTIVQVALNPQPRCLTTSPVALSSLNLALASDQNCVATPTNVGGTLITTSFCADSVWDVNATTTDPVTAAQITVDEGVAVRIRQDDASTYCP